MRLTPCDGRNWILMMTHVEILGCVDVKQASFGVMVTVPRNGLCPYRQLDRLSFRSVRPGRTESTFVRARWCSIAVVRTTPPKLLPLESALVLLDQLDNTHKEGDIREIILLLFPGSSIAFCRSATET